MPKISPLSVVDPQAELAGDVEVGPFCTVGPMVVLGAGNRLISHVVLTGDTQVGQGNTFHPNAIIGGMPQDKKFRGEVTRLVIGNGNHFREASTVHVGTAGGGGVTRIGDDNLLMVNVHVGHDCRIGSRGIFANNVMLAGHTVIGDNVVMSGASGTHHFVSIGDFAFVAAQARLHHDVPPFVKVSDDDAIRGINSEGLRRAGVAAEEIQVVEDALRRLFFNREKPFAAALADFDNNGQLPPRVKSLIEFLHRRNIGKHGRYLESLRAKKTGS